MPSFTITQKEFDHDSIELVHIGPSIREGERLYSSILGPDRAVSITRFAPTLVTFPSISGDPRIPATLTCNPGVWSASPAPSFRYQWKSDGIDIPGAEAKTFVADETLDNTNITCEVTAISGFPDVSAVSSNSILVQIVESVEIREHDYAAISGMAQKTRLTNFHTRALVVTGMSVDQQNSVFGYSLAAISGFSAPDRLDMNALSMVAISGMASEARTVIKDIDLYVVSYPT